MKKLTLLRHAKSGWDDPVARDFDRPLNGKGKRAARTVGKWLREQGFAFDAAVASPAVRVMETLAAVSDGYGRAIEPRWDKRIYLASADALLDVIQEADGMADGAADSLLLAGHNPGLEDLVLMLIPEGADGARSEIEEKYPTASVAELLFEVDAWSDIAAQRGRIARFIRPRDLDPELGPDTP